MRRRRRRPWFLIEVIGGWSRGQKKSALLDIAACSGLDRQEVFQQPNDCILLPLRSEETFRNYRSQFVQYLPPSLIVEIRILQPIKEAQTRAKNDESRLFSRSRS